MINADLSVAGYKEVGQVPFIEGEITDQRDLVLADLVNLENTTVTLELASGKVFSLNSAWFAADGNAQTENANIQVRFEGLEAEETGSGGTGLDSGTPPGIDIPDSLSPFSLDF